MQELLAELPGEGLPEEYWFKGKENNQVVNSAQEAEVKTLCLSDEDRAEIQEVLDEGKTPRSSFVAKIPPSETQLLQQILKAMQRFLLEPIPLI